MVRADADSADLNRDDYVRVKGSVGGQFEGENAFGAKRQAVEVQADSVDPVDPADALDPAQNILKVGQTRENQGFSATIDRIEFGEETTRVNVTARNNSGYKIRFFTHNAKIVQGSKQVDPDRYYSPVRYSRASVRSQPQRRDGRGRSLRAGGPFGAVYHRTGLVQQRERSEGTAPHL